MHFPFVAFRMLSLHDSNLNPPLMMHHQVNAVMKVRVRTAVPLSHTVGVPQAEKVFSRAVSVVWKSHMTFGQCVEND